MIIAYLLYFVYFPGEQKVVVPPRISSSSAFVLCEGLGACHIVLERPSCSRNKQLQTAFYRHLSDNGRITLTDGQAQISRQNGLEVANVSYTIQ